MQTNDINDDFDNQEPTRTVAPDSGTHADSDPDALTHRNADLDTDCDTDPHTLHGPLAGGRDHDRRKGSESVQQPEGG